MINREQMMNVRFRKEPMVLLKRICMEKVVEDTIGATAQTVSIVPFSDSSVCSFVIIHGENSSEIFI